MQELGFNFRITDIQCTLGISQLKKIDKFISRRRKLVNKYDEAFKDLKNIENKMTIFSYILLIWRHFG